MDNLSITQIARLLRKNQTQQEKKLWNLLRGKQIGFKIRRQHPLLDHYIIDFYCPAKKLCIEIDGTIHLHPEVKANDIVRQNYLLDHGYLMIRFTNEEVDRNPELVVQEIRSKILSS
jgi:very-short-patch-repair endonuclease